MVKVNVRVEGGGWREGWSRYARLFERHTIKCRQAPKAPSFPPPSTFNPQPCLPGCLSHAGDHPLQRQLAEADTAEPEATQERARPAATAAAIVLPHRELRLPLALLDHGLTSHQLNSLIKVAGTDCWCWLRAPVVTSDQYQRPAPPSHRSSALLVVRPERHAE